jgi:hypothetical protein
MEDYKQYSNAGNDLAERRAFVPGVVIHHGGRHRKRKIIHIFLQKQCNSSLQKSSERGEGVLLSTAREILLLVITLSTVSLEAKVHLNHFRSDTLVQAKRNQPKNFTKLLKFLKL